MSAVTTSFPLTPANTGFQFDGPGAGGAVSINEQAVNLPNAWVTGVNVVDKAGQTPTSASIKQACGNGIFAPPPVTKGSGGLVGGRGSVRQAAPDAENAFNQCIHSLGAKYHEVVTYQPASHFWAFQTIETVLFVLLALALAGGCAWWVRHRVT